MVCDFGRTDHFERLEPLGIFSQTYRLDEGDMINSRHIMGENIGGNLHSFSNLRNDNRLLSHALTPVKPEVNTLGSRMRLPYRAVNLGNSLPAVVEGDDDNDHLECPSYDHPRNVVLETLRHTKSWEQRWWSSYGHLHCSQSLKPGILVSLEHSVWILEHV